LEKAALTDLGSAKKNARVEDGGETTGGKGIGNASWNE